MCSVITSSSTWKLQLQAAVCSFSSSSGPGCSRNSARPCHSTMISVLSKACSPTTYLLLLVLQILQYCCHADASSIDIAPSTQHANLSSMATFYCRATGFNTRWIIGTATYSTNNQTTDGYIFIEVLVRQKQGGIGVHDLYLQMPATIENNGTEVQCLAFDTTTSTSDMVSLIVQGGPAAPVPVLTMISPTKLWLEWNAPFTWPYTTIQHYKLRVNNSLENWNHSLTNTSVEIKTGGNLAECIIYIFSVSANNGLAEGQQGSVSGGFPIVDPPLPANPIEFSIQYDSDFTPIVQVSLRLPIVCGYQSVAYNLTVADTNSRVVLHEVETVLYDDGAMLEFVIPGSQLDASVTSLHASVTFDLVGVEAQLPSLTAEMTEELNLKQDTEQVVLIAAVSGAAGVVILAVFIVVVAFVCAYKKKRSRLYRSGSPKNSPMVTNPIYEGQSVYETIDPQFRTISFSNSIPGPPTPTSARPVIESPYSHSQVDPAYASAHPNNSPFPPMLNMEEGYTVMTSAAGLGKRVPEHGESNLDQTAPDNSRYVPEPSMVVNEC